MSRPSEQSTSEGEPTVRSDSNTPKTCLLCSKPIESRCFEPYCSLLCAKSGVAKRYSLLRTFIDFESKYINPVIREEPPPLEAEKVEESGDTSSEKSKKSKKWVLLFDD